MKKISPISPGSEWSRRPCPGCLADCRSSTRTALRTTKPSVLEGGGEGTARCLVSRFTQEKPVGNGRIGGALLPSRGPTLSSSHFQSLNILTDDYEMLLGGKESHFK